MCLAEELVLVRHAVTEAEARAVAVQEKLQRKEEDAERAHARAEAAEAEVCHNSSGGPNQTPAHTPFHLPHAPVAQRRLPGASQGP